MTNEQYNKLETKSFKDLKIGEKFMTVGNEVYIKKTEDTAECTKAYDDDTYRFSSRVACKSLNK